MRGFRRRAVKFSSCSRATRRGKGTGRRNAESKLTKAQDDSDSGGPEHSRRNGAALPSQEFAPWRQSGACAANEPLSATRSGGRGSEAPAISRLRRRGKTRG